MGFKMNKPSMAISYGGESVQQHKSNLMKDNPVAKDASALNNLNKGYGSSESMANMNGSPFHETKQKSLPSYDQAYDAQSDEKKKTQSREQFKKEAKAYNKKKYGTTEPSKDSKKAGVTREQLADNKKTSDTTKSFDKKVVKKEISKDKQSSSPDDTDTRKGRKKMKNTDKASGKLSRKEIKSRKIQRKAQAAEDQGGADSKKAIRLKKRESNRKERLAKNKK
jgi:colicin import membrane protein